MRLLEARIIMVAIVLHICAAYSCRKSVGDVFCLRKEFAVESL